MVIAGSDRLDMLLTNAGPARLSTDGYKIPFAIKHMGYAVLAMKLLPLLEEMADLPNSDVRVICTTSLDGRMGPLTSSSWALRWNQPSWAAGLDTEIVN